MYWIGIDTTYYSKIVRAFLEKYPEAEVPFNKRPVKTGPDGWCTNQSLKSLRDFSLSVGKQVVLFFHGRSEGLKAAEDQLNFIKGLESRKLLHFRILREKPSFFQRLFGKK